jgi:hypothetical protein
MMFIYVRSYDERVSQNLYNDDDVYLCKKLRREGVTKSILYMLPYRPAKKAWVSQISMIIRNKISKNNNEAETKRLEKNTWS